MSQPFTLTVTMKLYQWMISGVGMCALAVWWSAREWLRGSANGKAVAAQDQRRRDLYSRVMRPAPLYGPEEHAE